MAKRRINGDSWADVYGEGTFSGRIYRMAPGEATSIGKTGSIIVGPGAIVRIETPGGKEILNLPPNHVVADLSELRATQPHAYVRVGTSPS